jgi:hypothetical protein
MKIRVMIFESNVFQSYQTAKMVANFDGFSFALNSFAQAAATAGEAFYQILPICNFGFSAIAPAEPCAIL